jgi:hypothetical protein
MACFSVGCLVLLPVSLWAGMELLGLLMLCTGTFHVSLGYSGIIMISHSL